MNRSFVKASLVFLLAVGVLAAQSPVKQGEQQANVYSFDGWKAGSYNVSLVIGEAGEIVSISTLTVVSVPPPSTTPTDPKPPPTGDTERIDRIKAVVPDDIETAKNIAGLMNVLAMKARAGEFDTTQQLSDVFSTTLNMLLDNPARAQAWAEVWMDTDDGSEGVIADEWIAVAQRGGTIDDYTALLHDVSLALGGADLEAFDINTIIEIVTIVMKGDLKLADYARIIQLVLSLFAK